MNCPKHPNEKMIQLFSSWACDVCDGKKASTTNGIWPITHNLLEPRYQARLPNRLWYFTAEQRDSWIDLVSTNKIAYEPFFNIKQFLLAFEYEIIEIVKTPAVTLLCTFGPADPLFLKEFSKLSYGLNELSVTPDETMALLYNLKEL